MTGAVNRISVNIALVVNKRILLVTVFIFLLI